MWALGQLDLSEGVGHIPGPPGSGYPDDGVAVNGPVAAELHGLQGIRGAALAKGHSAEKMLPTLTAGASPAEPLQLPPRRGA